MLLNNDSIHAAVEDVRSFLKNKNIDEAEALRVCLSVEEVLLEYKDQLGENVEFRLLHKKRFGSYHIIIAVGGKSYDPFQGIDDEIPLFFLTNKAGESPSWQYKNRKNIVRFNISAKKRDIYFYLILAAAVLGSIGGLLCRSLPENLINTLCDDYLSPVSNAILGLIGSLAVVLIFVLIVSGIAGMNDISTFNNVGKRMLSRFLLLMFGSAVFCALICLAFFPSSTSGTANLDFAKLWKMIIDIVPTNIFQAFLNGNTLQIVFLAIITGVVMLVLNNHISSAMELNTAIGIIFRKLLQIVIKLMPIVVLISMFKLSVNDMFNDIASIWKYPVLVALCCLLNVTVFILRTTIKHHMRISVLIRKLMPTFMIGLITASSLAAFEKNSDTCTNKLGIDKRFLSIGIPLGQTLYKPGLCFYLICGTFCMAEIYRIPIPLPQLITMAFSVFIISFAAPPIAGVGISSFTILCTQFGIPTDAVAVIIVLDVLIDRIVTATDLSLIQMELVEQASSLERIDRNILRSK